MELCEAIGRMRDVADGPLLAGVDADALRVLLSAITRVTTLVKCKTCDKGVRWRHAVKEMCPDCAAGAIDRLIERCGHHDVPLADEAGGGLKPADPRE